MNYLNIYNNLIEKAKNRTLEGYYEKHHILPKSMGGSNNKDNLVNLTAKEHYLAHLLLYKIHNNLQMHHALWLMSNGRNGKRYNVSSRKYEQLRKERSELLKGISPSEETKEKMKKSRVGKTPNKGKKFSEEWKKKIGEASKISRVKYKISEKQSIEFRGDGNPNAKLTEKDALYVKQLLLTIKMADVERITGYSHNIVNKIKQGKTWKHLNTREDQ